MSKKTTLIPPDLARCQAEQLEGSFMTLGPRKLIRCGRRPVWVAKERKTVQGVRGSMSLCEDCKKVLVRLHGKNFATFRRI